MLFMYMYVHTFVHSCRLVRLLLCAFCPLCLFLQACQDGGEPLVFGIGSVDSAQFGDVTTSDWTFTMSYTNTQQNKASHVTYKLATSGGTQFSFISESPPNTYVSCSLSLSYHASVHAGSSHCPLNISYGQTCTHYTCMHDHCHRMLTNRHACIMTLYNYKSLVLLLILAGLLDVSALTINLNCRTWLCLGVSTHPQPSVLHPSKSPVRLTLATLVHAH